MRRLPISLLIAAMFAGSSLAHAQEQAQPPDPCEMGVNAAAKNCSYGMDRSQSYYQTNVSCAAERIGVPTYTAQMSVFNDTQCIGGPCNNSIPGIAHRTWPLGSKVQVCDLKTNICAIAVVMDRGPNVCLVQRTIDANPTLEAALHATGLDPATYTLLSAPGVGATAQPSGPTTPSLEAIQAANAVHNAGASGLPSMTYTAVNTPWGPGYVGTVTGQPSSAFSGVTSIGQPSITAAPQTWPNTPITATNPSATSCAPRYLCSGSTLYYQTSECIMQTVQVCQSGCVAGACTPSGNSPPSSTNNLSNAPLQSTTNQSPTVGSTASVSETSLSPNFSAISTTSPFSSQNVLMPILPPQTTTTKTSPNTSVMSTLEPAYVTFPAEPADQSISVQGSSQSTGIGTLLTSIKAVLLGILSYLRSVNP